MCTLFTFIIDFACHVIATGNRRNRWSVVTIRLALAVFTRSPAAYDALKSFGLIQLPSRATLQAYTGAFRDDAGKYRSGFGIKFDNWAGGILLPDG